MFLQRVAFRAQARCLQGLLAQASCLLTGRLAPQRFQSTSRQLKGFLNQAARRTPEASLSWNPTIRALAARTTPTLLFKSRSRVPNITLRLGVGLMCYAYAAFHTYTSVLNPPQGFHPILRTMVEVVIILMIGAGSFVIFRRLRAVQSITALPKASSQAGQQYPLLLRVQISRLIPIGPRVITVPCRDITLTRPLQMENHGANINMPERSEAGFMKLLTMPFRLLGSGVSNFYSEFQQLFWQRENPLLQIKGYRGSWNIDADARSFALDNGARLNEVVRSTFS